MLWDGDLSCPSASEFLGPGHWGLSLQRRAPTWQLVCRAPSALTHKGRPCQGSRHKAGQRVDLLPLLSCRSPSQQPSLLSSFIRCQMVTHVPRGTENCGLHPGLCQQHRTGNRDHFNCSAVPASAGGVLAGRDAPPRSPTQHCTPSGPVLLAVCPRISHSVCLSVPLASLRRTRRCAFLTASAYCAEQPRRRG